VAGYQTALLQWQFHKLFAREAFYTGGFFHGRLFAQEAFCTGGFLHWRLFTLGVIAWGLIAREAYDWVLLVWEAYCMGGLLHGRLMTGAFGMGALLVRGHITGGK
jgi:hypothetical protein